MAKQRPVPDDFAECAAELSIIALGRKYHVGHVTIREWRKELGIKKKEWRKLRPVAQYDADTGELIATFSSIKEAGESLYGDPGNNARNIWQCCVGRIKTSHGFVWRYCQGKEGVV